MKYQNVNDMKTTYPHANREAFLTSIREYADAAIYNGSDKRALSLKSRANYLLNQLRSRKAAWLADQPKTPVQWVTTYMHEGLTKSNVTGNGIYSLD